MCAGECKDRMGDAFAKFGRVPILRRTRIVASEDRAFLRRGRAPFWAAGGLVHDGRGNVVLVRVRPSETARWFTPGGLLETGETTDGGLRREVREEVGLDLGDLALTRIIHETLTDGRRAVHGYFAQFIARATSPDLRPGHEVVEARWFDSLPPDLAFRDDYLDDFSRVRRAATF
ncbi:MAG TPA: NUDIX hydrolase [Thermoplasmata archaeon]|jgi:8-oxo-dGTP pyrophosphatase MutT (NUDIX family)|nr:NUDIX hydrolase [Thermoplasmata archaeon]